MASFDVDAALRWLRLDPQRALVRRLDDELPFLSARVGAGPALLLDTCVYIDGLKGRLPAHVAELLRLRHVHHSTVSIQELMFGIGALDPKHPRTSAAIAEVRNLIRSMPAHRVVAPDNDLLGRAAMLAGLLCRLQGYTGEHRKRALMDATLFLQGHKLGLVVVTRNIGDFDILLQLLSAGRSLFYRTEPHTAAALQARRERP